MQFSFNFYLIYLVPIVLIWGIFITHNRLKSKKNLAIMQEEVEDGLSEPVSLHPLIDPAKCMGCGSCAKACPEQHNHPVLGMIDDKVQLISPTNCIGHGACKSACPFNAITLVFGTERRGVDIPVLKPNFETSMPGIYIAGELGGMGLIRNAITQGCEALDCLHEDLKARSVKAPFDVVIVGAGPAGFSASLRSMEKKLRYKTVEQDSLGGAVLQFPRRKLVMAAPVNLPMVGMMKLTDTTKEELLAFWKKVEKETAVRISYHERVEAITPHDKGGYVVKTNKRSYHSRSVLLAVGRSGTPKKLGVEGEERSKVTYRLVDPEQYSYKNVLVVGGGDSALEAATSIADQPGTTVTLSYRSNAFSRAKRKNRERLEQAVNAGRIDLVLNSKVISFSVNGVTLDQQGRLIEIPNDAAIISIGGILPTGFLKETGIHVETKHGTA
jgi:thioredoxin reductase/NAD-dependent dihydropyrimidine dehydrogenase PreA subunit